MNEVKPVKKHKSEFPEVGQKQYPWYSQLIRAFDQKKSELSTLAF